MHRPVGPTTHGIVRPAPAPVAEEGYYCSNLVSRIWNALIDCLRWILCLGKREEPPAPRINTPPAPPPRPLISSAAIQAHLNPTPVMPKAAPTLPSDTLLFDQRDYRKKQNTAAIKQALITAGVEETTADTSAPLFYNQLDVVKARFKQAKLQLPIGFCIGVGNTERNCRPMIIVPKVEGVTRALRTEWDTIEFDNTPSEYYYKDLGTLPISSSESE